jgi:acid stress-induced BolA-like protein IbaG/YrbA
MLSPEQVRIWIAEILPCEHLSVDGDGHHFQAVIVSAEFAGLSRIARHQKINAALRDKLESNELHALSMKTLTPEEWAVQRG